MHRRQARLESQATPLGTRRLPARLCLLVLLSAIGCGHPAEDEDRIEIEFWHGMGELEHQALLEEFAAEFMAEHPGVVVRPVFQGLYGTLYQKIIAAVTARNPPELAMMYESWTTRLYLRRRLVPVQAFVEGPNGWSGSELADFYPAFLENNTWAQTLVTLPFNKSAHLLQYNADLLARAGWSRPPRTWDELETAARDVAALEVDGRPCRGIQIRPQLESFTTLFFSAGGDFLTEEGQPAMERPEARTTMDFLMELIAAGEGTAFVDRNYPAVVLGTGTLGMFIYSSASFPFNERYAEGKFRWAAAPVPPPASLPPEQRKTLFQGFNVGMFAGHSDAEMEFAWAFLKYMLEPEQAARWSMQTGYCPVRRSVADQPAMQALLREQPAFAVLLGEVEHAAFEPKPDFWEAWRSGVGDAITDALQGVLPAEAALAEAQKEGWEAIRYDSKFPGYGLAGLPAESRTPRAR